MAGAFDSITSATRQGGSGIVVEGVDAVTARFTRKAEAMRPLAGKVAVEHARKVAQRMRDTVAIGPDPHHVLDSITSDDKPTFDRTTVYADAGPDPDADPGAFVARFLEHGRVKQAPQPFAGPAGDEVAPEFFRDIGRLA